MASPSSSNSDPGSKEKSISKGRSFPSFIILSKNNTDTFLSASNVLLRFANNILKAPENLRYRKINLGNEVFMTKLLPIDGAVDCLFSMGFQEQDDSLFLNPTYPLDDLTAIRDALLDETDKINNSNIKDGCDPAPTVVKKKQVQEARSMPKFVAGEPIVFERRELRYVPRLHTQEERTFFQKLLSRLSVAFMYENGKLQDMAKQCIPIEKLKEKATKDFEAQMPISGESPVWSEKDCFLLNLLAWFKNDFFTWTNAPSCSRCVGETKFYSSDGPYQDERKWDCGNVECYQCVNCSTIVRYPRYNHPQKLLETRTGRCGEWANCFTLCCRAVGFDARFVLDWTDHVWTEVYSEHQQRWLHCDSCENACDKPLLYEQGWGKKLSYVVSISNEEVVDVTWRYTARNQETYFTHLQKDVIARRNLVPEQWLVDFCTKSTEELQGDHLDGERRKLLMKRRLAEMVESIAPKALSKKEEEGRVSGSVEWRKARGELGDTKKSHLFTGSDEAVKKKRMRVRYFPVRDCYSTSLEEDGFLDDANVIHGWENGVECSESIFRKIETDWQMIYLARCEGTPNGTIQWGIDVSDKGLSISIVSVTIQSKLYESGEIVLKLFSENKSVVLEDGMYLSPDAFAGSQTLRLSACLKGSSGDVAWQHAQLFRTAKSDENFVGLEFNITFSE